MKKYISVSMFAIMMLLVTSCNDAESTLQPGKVITFTASIEDGMNPGSRAIDATDEAITRAVLEIYDASDALVGSRIEGVISGNSITFTAELEEGANYTCLFWADGGTDAYSITNLKAITRGTAPSIAYYAKEEITASSAHASVTLTHAVAKVVLDETGTLAAGDKVGVAFTIPAYTFNVSDGSCTAEANEAVADEFTISNATTGQVGWLYLFAPATGADPVTITLSYTENGGSKKSEEMSNVPLKQNYRTVLRGAYEEITGSDVAQGFNVTLDKEWTGDEDHYLLTLTTTAAGEIASDYTLIEKALNTNGALVVAGPINAADIGAIRNWARNAGNTDKLKKLDLSQITGLTELPTSAFSTISSLISITLPETITTIKLAAFNGCSSLEGITFPSGVAVIGYSALYCAGLEYFLFEGTLPAVSSSDNDPAVQSGKLVLNEYCVGFPSSISGFNLFLPNVTDKTVAETYHTFFSTADAVYYNYTGSGNRTDSANYTKWEE